MNLHPRSVADGHDREPGRRVPDLLVLLLVCALLLTVAVLAWWSWVDAPMWDGPVAPP